MSDAVEQFVKSADRMPSLPTQMGRLLMTINNPNSSTKDIESLIVPDVTLSAKVLRMSNSAFYFRQGQVTNISEALVRLGYRTTRSLVITVWTHTLKAFNSSGDAEELLSSILQHGTACAVLARSLLIRRNRPLAEDAFVAGLLHDMGRVALGCQLGGEYNTSILEQAVINSSEVCPVEQAVLGFDHCVLGARLMESWNLPEVYIHAALHHHARIVDPSENEVLAAVMLADDLATRIGYNVALPAHRPARDELIDYFGVEDMNTFLEECGEQIQAMVDVLKE